MSQITPLVASTTAPSAPAATPAQAGKDREQLKAAAKQFEAIFVRQMLAEARKAHFGNNLFGSQGMDTFRQMQDERFAEIASDRGAFGICKMLEAQLARQLPPEGQISRQLPPEGTR